MRTIRDTTARLDSSRLTAAERQSNESPAEALVRRYGKSASGSVSPPSVASRAGGDDALMTTLKTHRFATAVRWSGDHLMHVSAAGRPELTVGASAEFRGGLEDVWSPEDLLVAAVASSYAIPLSALAASHGVPLHSLDVVAAGDATRRVEGSFGFTVIELDVSIATDRPHEDSARTIAELAAEGCLVTASLSTPVRVSAEIHAASRTA